MVCGAGRVCEGVYGSEPGGRKGEGDWEQDLLFGNTRVAGWGFRVGVGDDWVGRPDYGIVKMN